MAGSAEFGIVGAGSDGRLQRYTEPRSAECPDGSARRAAGIVRRQFLGGRIAWRFAADNPEGVDKLVLISPDGFASPGFEYGKRPQVPPALKLMKYFLPKPMLRMNLAPAYGDAAHPRDDDVTRYSELLLAPGSRAAMIARMEQSVLPEPEPLLRRIQAPTLLVWGEKDAMIPFKNAADYLRTIPHARLVSFPGLGHVPHEEAPAESLAPVIQFLRQSIRP